MKRFTKYAALLTAFLLFALPVHAADLLVSAAASLTNAYGEMKEPFEKANPGTTLVFNFAASGSLLRQMEQGAPVDVFASADQPTMDRAGELIDPESRTDFAGNSLVLIVPAASTLPLTGPEDLQQEQVKLIAVGNPDSVPVGSYTKTALTAAGLYEALTPKFVLAESVRQALDYVVRGETQAGLVYATDAAQAGDKVKVTATVEGHAPITYPIARLRNSANKDMAQAFIDYVTSPEGQAILAKYGFTKP
jgi:molybdate transport system substrate-binding protein